MICCCAHFIDLHAPPAAPGEKPGKCGKPGCECGLFEPDPVASQPGREPVIETRSPKACGCVDLVFVDGRTGQWRCRQHCFEELGVAANAISRALGACGIAFRRLAMLEAEETEARTRAENEEILRRAGLGPRRMP